MPSASGQIPLFLSLRPSLSPFRYHLTAVPTYDPAQTKSCCVPADCSPSVCIWMWAPYRFPWYYGGPIRQCVPTWTRGIRTCSCWTSRRTLYERKYRSLVRQAKRTLLFDVLSFYKPSVLSAEYSARQRSLTTGLCPLCHRLGEHGHKFLLVVSRQSSYYDGTMGILHSSVS